MHVDGGRPNDREQQLRRMSVNLIPMLPEDYDDALAVLDHAKSVLEFIHLDKANAGLKAGGNVVPLKTQTS